MQKLILLFIFLITNPVPSFAQGEHMPYNLFANQQADQKQLKALVLEIANLQGELRLVHLNTHLEIKRLLSAEQIQKYDELRGYKVSGQK